MASNRISTDDALGLLKQAITIAQSAMSSEYGDQVDDEIAELVPDMMALCDQLGLAVERVPSPIDFTAEHRLGAFELLGVR